jgi:hypothetical protein
VFSSGFSEALFSPGRTNIDHSAETFGGYELDDSDAEDDDDTQLTPIEEHAQTSRHPLTDPSTPVAELEEPDPDTAGLPMTPRAALSHPGSPRAVRAPTLALASFVAPPAPGPAKMRVVVRDASYWTYRAMLHYVRPSIPVGIWLTPRRCTPTTLCSRRLRPALCMRDQ